MANKKITKRALFGSVMALVLCCAMLVGSTFAWFTDSANTAVSSVKSGTLDVDLIDENDESVDGEALNFIKADGSTEILWEPGCTYVLPKVFIKNNGNLALKYKITVSGVNGDAELLDVIDWTIKIGDETIGEDGLEWHLSAGQKSSAITISGHMQETAGNEYQNMTLDGIGITVVATQWTEESDSFNNTYDEGAAYPAVGVVTPDDVEEGATALTFTAGDSVTLDPEEEGFTNLNFIKNDGGNVVFADGNVTSGTTGDYATINDNGATTTFNGTDIHALGGGVAVVGGSKVVFNSGRVYVDTASTSGRYIFYLEGEGSELTINGGVFSWDKADNQKRAYIYAKAGTTVYVKGGTFGAASTRDGYTAGILGDGTVIITGGTFGFDPSDWVAEGYQAVQNGSTWTVSAK